MSLCLIDWVWEELLSSPFSDMACRLQRLHKAYCCRRRSSSFGLVFLNIREVKLVCDQFSALVVSG
ncbi:hypothetical protein BVRB_9g221580 isoform B [Beta vulgaris subsp. vulgaris]|nr:hypothetical protein BVRB_9g221580 isoform B [Beta vulgaris subsp. vulgaris]